MIRPLRKRHGVMIITLSVVVPATFAVGIATRKAVPALSVTVPGFSAEAPRQKELWRRDGLWEKKAIRTRILNLGAGTGQLAVELTSKGPDCPRRCTCLLVTWATENRGCPAG